MNQPLLRLRDLTVTFGRRPETGASVRGVSFDLHRGEVLGIVGESGSGKSATANAIMGLHPPRSTRVTGSIELDGTELIGAPESKLNSLRGARIAMIFQDPMASLNPVMTVGAQVAEALRIHQRGLTSGQARERTLELLRVVGIPHPEQRIKQYPHEFSGGMRQRVVIAIAMANEPDVIIADEPTTALDVTVQAQVMAALDRAREHVNAALILVTHDLGVVAGRADRVLVMYGGRVVESGPTAELFERSRMPYTRGLLAATPRIDEPDVPLIPIPGAPPAPELLGHGGCPFAPRCSFRTERCDQDEPELDALGNDHASACHYAKDRQHLPDQERAAGRSTPRGSIDRSGAPLLSINELRHEYKVNGGKVVYAVDGVTLDVWPGETVGLVGESGCGKSSAGRSIVRLQEPTAGEVTLRGSSVTGVRGAALKDLRSRIQMVFQDPQASLDARFSVRQIIGEALRYAKVPRSEWDERIAGLLTDVGLSPSIVDRYPHEFSGGQRQRLGIARALATGPDILVLDEPVSALDVSVQAGVINLLRSLQQDRRLGYVFIAHDLSVVASISDRIAVMYLGRIVELGPTRTVLGAPRHPYTRALISAVPIPDPAVERGRAPETLAGDVPSPMERIEGCRFRSRCPVYRLALDSDRRTACEQDAPELGAGDHSQACHYPDVSLDELPTN
ncbi:ABC transporter ATP-binding protein [Kribbella hippodromi]|uniref:ABC transporter ATP-binding protein n=1 Tax=Kribbella hippodromi TaxID=434347 RepID=A0ABN2E3X5_9ACTN